MLLTCSSPGGDSAIFVHPAYEEKGEITPSTFKASSVKEILNFGILKLDTYTFRQGSLPFK
jgi:hypothetical protein